MSNQYLEENKEVSYRESNALKDLHTVKKALGRRGSFPTRNSGNTLRNVNISNNRIATLDKLGQNVFLTGYLYCFVFMKDWLNLICNKADVILLEN